jgi:hypothetical protein
VYSNPFRIVHTQKMGGEVLKGGGIEMYVAVVGVGRAAAPNGPIPWLLYFRLFHPSVSQQDVGPIPGSNRFVMSIY